jgi:serine/threonine protein kinase
MEGKMSAMLQRGRNLIVRGMQAACVVREFIGEGAQAEIYRATINDADYAVKWYRPEYVSADRRVWQRLKEAINRGCPTEKFLWPFDLVSLPRTSDYGGYVMPLKEPQFISLVDLLRRRSQPSFRALATLGFHLAEGFLKLHASGLCYRDINFGNVFFDPKSGDGRIGDTDNVDLDGKPGRIAGTLLFMAPEVASGRVEPNSMSDRFSLAVLLFYIFMLGHPLKGKRETEIKFDPADPDGSLRLCTEKPVFVFDPDDASNRPVAGIHDAVLNFWNIYPHSLQTLFTRGFTRGLLDPEARVMDNDWRKEMARLKDAIFTCMRCCAENFFDLERLKNHGSLQPCWSCGHLPQLPPRIRIGDPRDPNLVMLDPGVELFPHHLAADSYNFSAPLARVVVSPLGLQNLSSYKWAARVGDQPLMEIAPGCVLGLTSGCKIHFGRAHAEIRM